MNASLPPDEDIIVLFGATGNLATPYEPGS